MDYKDEYEDGFDSTEESGEPEDGGKKDALPEGYSEKHVIYDDKPAKPEDEYDKQAVYNKQIAPLVKELKLRCNANRLPMFVTVAVKNTSKDTKYESDMILASSYVSLKDNRIAKCLLHLNELEAEMPPNIQRALTAVLQYYIKEYGVKELNTADRVLVKDLADGMNRIVNCGDLIVFPKDTVGVDIADDFIDD